jgi:signal transduction histidine kinase
MVTAMLSSIFSYLSWFFSNQNYMPHGMCFLWQPELIWLHVISDATIALAYYAMPVSLIYFATQRQDIRFRGVLILTGLFILACGTTHVMNVWTLWYPDYRLDGVIKAITAVVSLGTSYVMWRSVPIALALPSTNQLERANRALADEVTRRSRTEVALREANTSIEARLREIESISLSLRDRSAELEMANEELETFSYTVSHDLRAPVRSMNGFCKALLEDYGDNLNDTARDYLRRIHTGSVRMGQLIDDLLNLSRVSRGELEHERVDLSAVAHAVIAELQETDPARNVAVEIAPGLIVQADPPLIRIALANLLGNAWKFTAKNPDARIEFGVTESQGKPEHYVRDNGVGFDMARAHKLFAPFQRLHSITEFEGTGIGLATVSRIFERHGGKVWIESALGHGTTVRFTL